MKQDTQKQAAGLAELGLSLDDIIRRGARQVIHQVIEAEFAQLLGKRSFFTVLDARRNGIA